MPRIEELRYHLNVLVNPDQPRVFSARQWWITAIVIGLTLAPILLYPVTGDGALFFVSGQRILQGAKLYHDIVDIKPPFIYYLNAGAIWLFGPSDVGLHIVDALIQGFTCFLIVATIHRASRNDLWAAIAGFLYAVLYVAQGHAGVGQTESYAGVVGLGVVYAQMNHRTPMGFLLIGLLLGALIMIKSTLGLMVAGVACAEVFVYAQSWRSVFRSSVWMVVGLAIVGASFVECLAAYNDIGDYMIVQQITMKYVRPVLASPGAWLKLFIQRVPGYMSDNYTVLMSLATATGAALSLPLGDASERRSETTLRTLQLFTFAFMAMILSVGAEGRFADYHFARIFAFGAGLSAYGLMRFVAYLLRVDIGSRYFRFVLLLLAFSAVLFSPVIRYVYHAGGGVVWATRGAAALDEYYHEPSHIRTQLGRIGRYVRTNRRPGDELYVAAMLVGMVYRETAMVPTCKLYHGDVINRDLAPAILRQATIEYLERHQPRFIVAETDEMAVDPDKRSRSSLASLRMLEGVGALLDTAYSEGLRTQAFVVYVHR